MPRFAGEARGDKIDDEVARERRPDDAGAEDKDVHVIMFHALVRGIAVVAKPRADAMDLVRRD